MRRPLAIAATAFSLLGLLSACGSEDEEGAKVPPAAQSTTAADAPETAGGCKTVDAPAPKAEGSLKAPSEPLAKGKQYSVRFTTSCGDFEIQLAAGRAPKTSASVTL